MIEHVVLFKLRPEVDGKKLEWMMRETRLRLLKIPSVLALRSGRSLDPCSEWDFFVSVSLDSDERLASYSLDPIHTRFVDDVIEPNTCGRLAMSFQPDPGENPLLS